MRRHEDDAVAAAQAFQVVVKAVVIDVLRNIAFIQFRKMREFDEQPREISKGSTQDPPPLPVAQFWKYHPKIVEAGAPLAAR